MDGITANDLCERIKAVHPAPEWACFFEVRSGAGWNRRSADAIAMNLWQSRGLTIRGFEIKVNRSDLKKEIADPDKAESIAKYCDEWWLVTPAGLVRDEGLELPSGWGLMEATNNHGLRTAHAAARKEAVPLTKNFVSQILKHARNMVASENEGWVRRESINEEIDKARELGKSMIPLEMERIKTDNNRLMKIFEEFKTETGIDLGLPAWKTNTDIIIKACKLGMAIIGEYGRDLTQLLYALENAEKQTKTIYKSVKELAEMEQKVGGFI